MSICRFTTSFLHHFLLPASNLSPDCKIKRIQPFSWIRLTVKRQKIPYNFLVLWTRRKLVAQWRRCERVYKRTAAASVTFCGKEEQRRERTLIFAKNRSKRYKACSDMVDVTGLDRMLRILLARRPRFARYPSCRSSLKMLHRSIFLTLRPSQVQALIAK